MHLRAARTPAVSNSGRSLIAERTPLTMSMLGLNRTFQLAIALKWQRCEDSAILWPQSMEIMTDQFLRKPHSIKIDCTALGWFLSILTRNTKIIKTFDKIFRIQLAVPHFSFIHFFYWKISHLEEILDLLSQNDVENMIIQALLCLDWAFHVIFDSKSKISPRWLIFQ